MSTQIAEEISTTTPGRLHKDYRPPRLHLARPPWVVRPGDLSYDGKTRAMRERLQCLEAIWQRKAREDVNAFIEYTCMDTRTGTPFQQQWFHEEWHHHMDTEPRVLIISPRATGKTSQMVGRLIWELGRNPELRTKIIGANDGRAKERLYEVQQNIRHNPRVRRVFPHLAPAADAPWNAHKIYLQRKSVSRDASVEALGITSSGTGGRADILIPDDVVDYRNSLGLPALRKHIKQVWISDWTQLLEPWSKVWAICTLWHKDDLNHMLMNNPAYKTLFYAIDQLFGAMWSDKWPEATLRQRHAELGSTEFNRAFRNMAIDIASQMVNPQWFRFVKLLEDEEFNQRVDGMHFLLSYDTAGSPTGKKEQDYSASVVGAVDQEAGKVYIIDAWHARYSLKHMAMRVNEEFMRYHPYRVLIEKVGQASLDEWVENDYPNVAPYIKVFKPQQSKGTRLLACTPLLESGKIVFSHHLDPNLPTWDPERGALTHELEDFGFTTHDDMADAFSQLIWAARWYFLDRRANSEDNNIDVRIDSTDDAESPYVFY